MSGSGITDTKTGSQKKRCEKMRENSRKIYVYENWSKDIPVKMGTLYADGNRGKEVYSFEYDISLILYFFYGSFKNASFFLFILQSVRPPNV